MSNKRRCAGCKLYFRPADLLVSSGVSVYCSKECVEKKHNARAKKRKKNTEQKVPQGIRNEVGRRDGQICELCRGLERRHAKGWLQLHHVTYRSEGGKHTADNLISLCNDCHAIVHSRKKLFQPYLLRLIKGEVDEVSVVEEA